MIRLSKSKYDDLMAKLEQLKRNLQSTVHAEARNVINKKIAGINRLLDNSEIVL